MAALHREEPFLNLAYYGVAYAHHARAEDLEHRIAALRKAGMPDWPMGFRGDPAHRVSGAALGSLIAAKTWSGNDRTRRLPFVQEFTTTGSTVYAASGTILNGAVRQEGDALCERFAGFIQGRPLCGPVYRDAGEGDGAGAGYVYVNPVSLRYFSVAARPAP